MRGGSCSPVATFHSRTSPVTLFVPTAILLIVGSGSVAALSSVLDRLRVYVDREFIQRDLLEDVTEHARVEIQHDANPFRPGALLPNVGVAQGGGNKPSLVMPPDARVTFVENRIRPYTRLTFSWGVDQLAVLELEEQGLDPTVTFAVEVAGDEALVKVSQTTVRHFGPPGRPSAQHEVGIGPCGDGT